MSSVASAQPSGIILRRGLALAETVLTAAFVVCLAMTISGWMDTGPTGALAPAVLATLSLGLRHLCHRVLQTTDQRAARNVSRSARLTVWHARLGHEWPRAKTRDMSGHDRTVLDLSLALEGRAARYDTARFQAVTAPVILIALAALFSPVCAAILTGAFVPFILIMAVIGLGTRDAARRQFSTLSRLSALFYDRLAALPLLSAFEAGPHQTRSVGAATRAVSASTLSVLRIAFINAAVLEFFAALSVALVAVYCGFSLLTLMPFPVPETLTFAEAFACLALAPEVYAPLRRLSAAYHDKEVAEAADTALTPLMTAPSAAPTLRLAAPPSVAFEALCLGFDDDPDARIGPLSAAVAPGGMLALTGPSGSGKTALLRTLIGHGRVTAGRLIVNAETFTRAPDLSADIAYIGQTTPVLSKSLRDNLTLGQPVTETALLDALSLCGLLSLWQARGGDTQLSADRHGLSGGEARRLGWVRALLKPAPLLILDEPTADLDPDAAADFVRVLNRLREGRTALLATHDPRLAALADTAVALMPEGVQ